MFSIQLALTFILTVRLKYKGVNMKSEILKCNSYLIYGLFMIIIIAADYGSPHTYPNLNISFRRTLNSINLFLLIISRDVFLFC